MTRRFGIGEKGRITIETAKERYRILNRDFIKYMAMIAMTLNHVAFLFLDESQWLGFFFRQIGYFTAPVMIFFLVEGYGYTHSKKKYLFRLLGVALVAQVPFSLMVSGGTRFFYPMFNMLFTLSLCFCVLLIQEYVTDKKLAVIGIAWIVLICGYCDWGSMAPLFTLYFSWAKGSEKKKRIAFFFLILCYYTECFLFGMTASWPVATTIPMLILRFLISLSGIGLAAVSILFLYNGKRMNCGTVGKTISKWFFYLYYPAHILVLVLILMLR